MHPRRNPRHLLERLLFPIRSFVSARLLLPPASAPVPTTLHRASAAGRSRQLVILLPGKGSRGKDFVHRGFVAAARDHRVAADLMAVDLHFGYYLKGDPLERLRHDVLEPARAAGYAAIHLAGISMGAAGALALARQHPGEFASLLLMGPFLGPGVLIEEIAAAGGLGRWAPSAASLSGSFEPYFARNWEYLRSLAADPAAPPLLLAFGTADRFAAAQRLLAESLPPGRVFTLPGGHDWTAWRLLWDAILSQGAFPLAGRPAPAAPVGAPP